MKQRGTVDPVYSHPCASPFAETADPRHARPAGRSHGTQRQPAGVEPAFSRCEVTEIFTTAAIPPAEADGMNPGEPTKPA